MEGLLSTQPPAYLFEPIVAVHPPDLETEDPTLATVILPAPPPLASINGQRRDSHLRRSAQVFSYLPASDPGTTYSGLMGGLGLSLIPEEEGRLRKRPRTDKSSINTRAQRSSARGLNPTASTSLLPPLEPSISDPVVDRRDVQPSLQRTGSYLTVSDESTPYPGASHVASRVRSRDKGKGKEKAAKVKEEPQTISLDMPEPNGQPNEDHCSACRSQGSLLYCDGCPRSFHLWCLDPPMDAQDVPEGDNRWYCPACIVRQHPPPRPRRSLLAPLFHHLQLSIPTEFELPEDIRGFFKDVTTGSKGSYQDNTETKAVRASRFNILDDREAFRLKDKNGAPILCFRCSKSALPDAESGPSSTNGRESSVRRSSLRHTQNDSLWKSIASCDYCSLHWHLDCLDPPLACMPPAHKKWMCPAHVEHIAPKRRIPKQVPPVTDITTRNRPNNGNIEIIPADNSIEKSIKMNVDEVHINGRRYRVPERVVVLDFWDKIGRGHRLQPPAGLLSGSSSPLTSLSSLDEINVSKGVVEKPSVSPSDMSTARAESEESDMSVMHAVDVSFYFLRPKSRCLIYRRSSLSGAVQLSFILKQQQRKYTLMEREGQLPGSTWLFKRTQRRIPQNLLSALRRLWRTCPRHVFKDQMYVVFYFLSRNHLLKSV
ncbi:hypothetical protein BU17DRAFT_58719 [Hysterangium stoloniferum]|nr:hypothetical protein BU17DRAFT_58719 [Hysterangium stoloniferum]